MGSQDFINPLKPSGYFMYHQDQHSKILHSAHTVYLHVLSRSQNKHQLFPHIELNDWFL